MKYLIMAAVMLMACSTLQAQWPVNNGSQGEITGTIGEVRTSGGPRIHNGTDCTGGANLNVYSIKNDQIQRINNASSLGFNRNITMKSGTRYFHVTYLNPNGFDIEEVNAGMITVNVTQREAFAEMIKTGGAPHVHITNGNNDNFLTASGFNAPSFTFVDHVIPQFGNDNIKVYKDLNSDQLWNQSPQFTDYVSNEGFAADERPLIIWGNVDITANVFQRRIGSDGNSLNRGAIAPYKLGYQLKNLATNSIEFKDFQRFQFDRGTGSTNYRKIHAKQSTSSQPIFIVSNQFLNGSANEDKLSTAIYRDGDYDLTVRAENTQGGTVEQSIKVRLDNYKTYIRRVSVKDKDGELRYESEWSALTRPNDGSIQVDRRNNEPFVNGAMCTIEVTTSEKVPSLQLKLAGGQAVALTQTDDEGKAWGGSFNLPSHSASKVQLSFESGKRLFGLVLNQETADVKRQDDGDFKASSSIDKNHELRICEGVDEPLSLDVVVDQTFENVTLVATGGTPPYEYSQDLAPIPPNHKSSFSEENNFSIVFDQNYLFKVRDDGGCEAQEYYTLPNVPCDSQNFAGGQGTDIRQVNLGTIEGTVSIAYQMYTIPDQLTINYRGNSQTTGIVSGTGTLSFEHVLAEGQSNQVTITVNAPNSGTAWNYQVICPDAATARATEVGKLAQNRTRLSYGEEFITISGYDDRDNYLYTLQYRQPEEVEWNRIPHVALPYELDHGGKELEIRVEREEARISPVTKLRVFPNPSRGMVNIAYIADRSGVVELSCYNTLGALLDSQEYSVSEGTNILNWNPNDAYSGLTLIKLSQQGKWYSTSVVIDKTR